MFFDAGQQSGNLGRQNPIIDRPSHAAAGQNPAGLEQSKMLAGLAGAEPAKRSDFVHGVLPAQQRIQHLQARRMGHRSETLGGRLHIGGGLHIRFFFHSVHPFVLRSKIDLCQYIEILRYINTKVCGILFLPRIPAAAVDSTRRVTWTERMRRISG